MATGGKIKGWDKQQSRGTSSYGKDIPAQWTNISDDGSKITTVHLGTKRVKITQSTSSGQKRLYRKSDFKKQERARKKAMSFMRKNPNP